MNKTLLGAAVVALGGLAWAPGAHADALVTYSINGGATTQICSATGACVGTASSSGVSIVFAGVVSNSPGSPSAADILGSTTSITNNGSANATIVLTLGDTGFTSPTAPPDLILQSHIGGTVLSGGQDNLLTFNSYVDPNNGQNTTSGAGVYSPTALTPSIVSAGSYNQTDSTTIDLLAAPFSLTEQLSVTLAPGAQINFSSSSRLQPVPEPGALALFGSALLGLCLLGRKRRSNDA